MKATIVYQKYIYDFYYINGEILSKNTPWSSLNEHFRKNPSQKWINLLAPHISPRWQGARIMNKLSFEKRVLGTKISAH